MNKSEIVQILERLRKLEDRTVQLSEHLEAAASYPIMKGDRIIRVGEDTYQFLKDQAQPKESFDATIRRLLGMKRKT